MALIDLRDEARVYQDGSSAIDIGLTAAQAKDALGDTTATGGWYRMAYQTGGDVGPDSDRQKFRDESTKVIGYTGTTNDVTISNTTAQTDARTLKLLAWLEKNAAPVRYFLPTNDPTKVQVHYVAAMKKDEGGRITTSAGVRTLPYTLRGLRTDYAFDDLPVAQTSWTGAFADAKDDVFPGT